MSSICSQLEMPSVVSVHIQSMRARSSSRNGTARKLTSQPHHTRTNYRTILRYKPGRKQKDACDHYACLWTLYISRFVSSHPVHEGLHLQQKWHCQETVNSHNHTTHLLSTIITEPYYTMSQTDTHIDRRMPMILYILHSVGPHCMNGTARKLMSQSCHTTTINHSHSTANYTATLHHEPEKMNHFILCYTGWPVSRPHEIPWLF